LVFLQETFTPLVYAHAGRTQDVQAEFFLDFQAPRTKSGDLENQEKICLTQRYILKDRINKVIIKKLILE
jgi:hypothetical protein